MMNLWTHLPDPTPTERDTGEELLTEFLTKGYVPRTVSAMARLPLGAITHFYRCLAEQRSVESPVSAQPHSGWMIDAAFCFINVRATGVDDVPGTFLQAAKVLPAIRAEAIHLGPFTDYDFNVVYAVRSVRTLAPIMIDHTLALSPEDQVRALVQAAHVLGKAIGFDVEPHMAQYAMPVIERPELFRWFKLSPDKSRLADGLSDDELLTEDQQQRLATEIRAKVAAVLDRVGVKTLEATPEDSAAIRDRKRQTYFELIGSLIADGYWPIPSQSWAGRGVPAFGGYNFEGNYARFAYRGEHGEDLSDSAFHILAPFKFYRGLTTNRAPDAPVAHQPAIDYFCDIFPYWRDEFGFDFVRYDSADHIFDSLAPDGRPAADRATPEILQRCITRTRTPDKPYVGNLAERMGNEIEAYAALGYDVILGDDMLQMVDAALVEKSFHLYDRLIALNRTRPQPASIAFSVDTHDTGDTVFWGEPLVKKAGARQMRLRHFLARFGSAGQGRRPKYEAIGSQDLSYGLYEANVGEVNLTWVGDESFNRHYHYLEDVYDRHRAALKQGAITRRYVDAQSAWWLIESAHTWLLAVITFAPSEPFTLDLPELANTQWMLTTYDFETLTATTQSLSAAKLDVPALAAETTRLYVGALETS